MQTSKFFIRAAFIFVGFLFAGTTLFIFLVLGVQHGDTYVASNQPSFKAAAKYVIKKSLHTVKNGMYHIATRYNPSGDTIPDWLDDAILGKIKQIF